MKANRPLNTALRHHGYFKFSSFLILWVMDHRWKKADIEFVNTIRQCIWQVSTLRDPNEASKDHQRIRSDLLNLNSTLIAILKFLSSGS